jgi:hypothetical protein
MIILLVGTNGRGVRAFEIPSLGVRRCSPRGGENSEAGVNGTQALL